jgi:hypothetical protein
MPSRIKLIVIASAVIIVSSILLYFNYQPDIESTGGSIVAEDPNTFFFPFLGFPSESATVLTTPLGCRVQAHGWDELVKPKRIRKARKFMISIGVPDYVQQEYFDYAAALPVDLLSWIDAAFLNIKEKWRECGGNYASVANRIQPSDINITLVPLPFWVPYYKKFAVGMTESNGNITICVAAITKSSVDSPTPDWLRRVDRLAEYYIGNRFALAAGIRDREIGNQSPCG